VEWGRLDGVAPDTPGAPANWGNGHTGVFFLKVLVWCSQNAPSRPTAKQALSAYPRADRSPPPKGVSGHRMPDRMFSLVVPPPGPRTMAAP